MENIFIPQLFKKQVFGNVLLIAIVLAVLFVPQLAFATEKGGNLPYEAGLEKLVASISGPVAFGISLLGIVAAGAALIFGGEMSGFLRTLVFLVLVIAIIVQARALIGLLGSEGATVAALSDGFGVGIQSIVRGLG